MTSQPEKSAAERARELLDTPLRFNFVEMSEANMSSMQTMAATRQALADLLQDLSAATERTDGLAAENAALLLAYEKSESALRRSTQWIGKCETLRVELAQQKKLTAGQQKAAGKIGREFDLLQKDWLKAIAERDAATERAEKAERELAQQEAECPECHGSGKCPRCDGSSCNRCLDGPCSSCNGSGRVEDSPLRRARRDLATSRAAHDKTAIERDKLHGWVMLARPAVEAVRELQEANALMDGPEWAKAFHPALRKAVSVKLPLPLLPKETT